MSSKKDYSEDARNLFFNEKNKLIKSELKEKYGMIESENSEDADPEIVNSFLSNVLAFEKAYENAESKVLIEILGFPKFKNANEISEEDLESAIMDVLALYAANNINIDVIEKEEVSNLEYYKFLTEELPQHETDFIQIDGMTTNYIYEEFHPSNKLDAKDMIEWMTPYLFTKEKDRIRKHLSQNNLMFNSFHKTADEFIDELLALFAMYGKNTKRKIQFIHFEFQDDGTGKVETEFILKSSSKNDVEKVNSTNIKLLFELERNDYDSFNIKGCIVL